MSHSFWDEFKWWNSHMDIPQLIWKLLKPIHLIQNGRLRNNLWHHSCTTQITVYVFCGSFKKHHISCHEIWSLSSCCGGGLTKEVLSLQRAMQQKAYFSRLDYINIQNQFQIEIKISTTISKGNKTNVNIAQEGHDRLVAKLITPNKWILAIANILFLSQQSWI